MDVKKLFVSFATSAIGIPVILIMLVSIMITPLIAMLGGVGGSSNNSGEIINGLTSLKGFTFPVENGAITPCFDVNGDGILDTASTFHLPAYKQQIGIDHNGVDIQFTSHEPKILAPHKGKIVRASQTCNGQIGTWCPANASPGFMAGGGNFIIMEVTDYPDTPASKSLYIGLCHLTSISASEGQTVEAGQVLGTGGSTGNVTGPHLHVQMWEGTYPGNLTQLNPEIIMEGFPGYQYLVMYQKK